MRQKSLFPGETLSEEELQEMISPLYGPLWHMIRDPYDDFAIRRASDEAFAVLTEGEAAQWMRPQIIRHARALFADDARIQIRKTRYQRYLRYEDQLAIVPKKIKLAMRWPGSDEELTYSNYPTRQNLDFWEQRALDGFPDLPRVIVGYQFIKKMSDIKIWVAYPVGRMMRECFLIPDQSGVVLGVFQPLPEVAADTDDRGVRVKPKRRDSQEDSQS